MDAASGSAELTHVRLLVSDFRSCFRFYRDVLGFEVTWGDETKGYADFRTGDTILALFERDAMAAAVGKAPDRSRGELGDVSLIFGVDDVDATVEALPDDVGFVTDPHDRPDWGIRVAHCRDPDGNLLEFNEPIDPDID